MIVLWLYKVEQCAHQDEIEATTIVPTGQGMTLTSQLFTSANFPRLICYMESKLCQIIGNVPATRFFSSVARS